MARLRVLYQLHREQGDDEDLLKHTAAARVEAGCAESECYQGFEHHENLALVELWDDEFVYSEHWLRLVQSGEAFETILRSSGERTYGRDGYEFYWQQIYTTKERVWTPPEDHERSSVVRWPGGAQVRIIGKSTRGHIEESLPQLIAYSEETRREPGCLQFEHMRSIEHGAEGDTINFELWTDQVIYDRHFLLRGHATASGAVLASGGGGADRPQRVFGGNGYEFYQCVRFTHLYDRWLPEDINRWSEMVRWRG